MRIDTVILHPSVGPWYCLSSINTSTCGGKCSDDSETGSGGSGDDSNGNDVGTCGGKCSDDGRGGNGGDGCSGW
ncbi:hypothetical protein Tco_1396021 [Tanacetum coccineum]